MRGTIRVALAAGLILGSPSVVLARGGGGDSGSGLSPYAAFNDRDPRLDPYLGA